MTTDVKAAQAPSLPVAILLILVPVIGVLQFRGIAAASAIGLAAAVVAHRRARGAWPWPQLDGPVLPLLATAALAVAGAAWALDPARSAITGMKFAGFVLLGAAAARVAAEDPAAPRLLPRALLLGLALAAGLTAADMLSGHAIRATVRGLATAPPELVFGLKPAVSVIAVLLPLAAALPGVPWAARAALVAAGIGAALMVPAESARISAVLGVAVFALARLAGPRLGLLVGGGIGAAVLAAPLVLALALPRLPALDGVPPSAAHRILIWDFAAERIAEKPWFGWGAEASRTIPGGRDLFDIATLDRFGLTSEASRAWFARPQPQRLPLHPHNAALQVWLDLGAAGAVLALWLALALGLAAARHGAGAVGALAAGAVTGMLSYGLWQEWWIGFALLVAAALPGLSPRRDQPG
ncbi:O-antigen ligase family protein [Roseomonas sp. HF4]|uniref:O-antigen ligase family protein n=1 Tax=Roseomonas sp. HF4 TaxID=2562313 RepID=UPI001484CD62|nr:O-antigen ligase family protein [Roseomonas sp. HF4]